MDEVPFVDPQWNEAESNAAALSVVSEQFGEALIHIEYLLSALDELAKDKVCPVCEETDHAFDCAYAQARRFWEVYQMPGDGPTNEDIGY